MSDCNRHIGYRSVVRRTNDINSVFTESIQGDQHSLVLLKYPYITILSAKDFASAGVLNVEVRLPLVTLESSRIVKLDQQTGTPGVCKN